MIVKVPYSLKEMECAPWKWRYLPQDEILCIDNNDDESVYNEDENVDDDNENGAMMLLMTTKMMIERDIFIQPCTQAHFTNVVTTSVKWVWVRGWFLSIFNKQRGNRNIPKSFYSALLRSTKENAS